MRVVSATVGTPPISPGEGRAYLVPAGAGGDWSGQDGRLAVFVNGAWVFLEPRIGWRLWDEESADWFMYDGIDWIAGAMTVSPGGASTLQRVIELDHTVAAGATSVVAGAIPAFAQVVGVTGRVVQAISGTATTWRLGVTGFDDRYGSGLGLGQNGFVLGLSGTPVSYYADTDLILSGEGGDLAGGIVRLAIHITELRAPRAV